MRHPCSESIGPPPPTTETSEASSGTSPSNPSSFSPEGSHARTSPPQESAPDSRALDPGCGPSTPGSSTFCGPDSCSSRMSRDYVPPASTPLRGTLPRAGMMRSGTWSELPPSAPRTSGRGSGSSRGTPHVCDFPTPAATAYGSSGNGTGNNVESRGRLSLEAMARLEAWPDWPTPNARDWKGPRPMDHARSHGRQLPYAVAEHPTPGSAASSAWAWPTPTSGDARSSGRHTTTTGVMHPGTSLTDAVRMWPTPKASDPRRGFESPEARRARGSGGSTLPEAVTLSAPGEAASSIPTLSPNGPADAPERSGPVPRLAKPVLNPDWVELLMGIPVGWTFVPCKPGNAPRPARSRAKNPRKEGSSESGEPTD